MLNFDHEGAEDSDNWHGQELTATTDLRRPRQRLAGRRHRQRQPVRRLGRRLCSTPTTTTTPTAGRTTARIPIRATRIAPTAAPAATSDRQHRRRSPDRLGRRVQQLHRAVRAVRPGHVSARAAAANRRVPLRPVAERRRRLHPRQPSDAQRRARMASSAWCASRILPGRTRPARRTIRSRVTSRAVRATCYARRFQWRTGSTGTGFFADSGVFEASGGDCRSRRIARW